jgi:ribosomal protein S18 acetylase RimI-like enzyme
MGGPGVQVKIIAYQGAVQYSLYAYWRKLGENIPYFFPVSPERWTECLLEDKLAGERMFDRLETYVAEDQGRVIGFAQVGHPRFSWDDRGAKYYNPQIGILRHFYFDTGRYNAAEAMYAHAQSFLMHYPRRYAYYHSYGMSCNAHHGKLYGGLAHVDRFIKAKGFQVEHENVYYSLVLNQVEQTSHENLRLIPQEREFYAPQVYKIMLHNTPIGTITVRFMDLLNGEAQRGAVYLSLFLMDETYRGKGWGTLAMQLLYGILRAKGYQHLHLDTASTNVGAQRFYTRIGFHNRGRSRSYVHR